RGWAGRLHVYSPDKGILREGTAPTTALAQTREGTTEQLAAIDAAHHDAAILDARPSARFRQASLRGAAWTIRPTLPRQLAGRPAGPVLLLGDSRARLGLLAHDLEQAGRRDIHLCVLDDAALRASGLPLADNADLPDEACIDYLFFVHDRHDGNKEAARKYLEWETNLVSQIDEQERRTFSVGA